ncbi:hypothetical protein HHL22_20665 [Hymenobacter sp. RP-2-7]|uniref:Uncharacterized protein n=1 Tax=Hymenobacter polaris TaxID=2682546 RepID=A0A7Y0FPG7_9BACT|nr:hypothetical protein [Hymenobacter polaris]NML67621.1 hypothetical protein [Hymenobacter polaris]
MTKESLAALLNGRDYREEIDNAEAAQAKAAGLVVVFGASDDLLEFRGAIYDEVGAWDGAVAVLFKGKRGWDVVPDDRATIREIEDDDTMMAALAAQKTNQKVAAEWAPKQPEASWLITTSLPHATFDILDDGGLYCRGVVLDVKDLN